MLYTQKTVETKSYKRTLVGEQYIRSGKQIKALWTQFRSAVDLAWCHLLRGSLRVQGKLKYFVCWCRRLQQISLKQQVNLYVHVINLEPDQTAPMVQSDLVLNWLLQKLQKYNSWRQGRRPYSRVAMIVALIVSAIEEIIIVTHKCRWFSNTFLDVLPCSSVTTPVSTC